MWLLSYVLWPGKRDRKIVQEVENVPSVLSVHNYSYPAFNKGYWEGYTAQRVTPL